MATMIEDGGGTGRKAIVDDHGRLYVVNNNVSHLSHHATWHKNAFTSKWDTTLADSSETPIVLLTSTDPVKDLEVFHMVFSSDANVKLSFYFKSGYTSGGVVSTPRNTNIGSGLQPVVTGYEGGPSANLVVDTTNETYIGSLYIGANSPHLMNWEGGLVIAGGYSMSVKATGAAGNNVSAIFTHTTHDHGTKL